MPSTVPLGARTVMSFVASLKTRMNDSGEQGIHCLDVDGSQPLWFCQAAEKGPAEADITPFSGYCL